MVEYYLRYFVIRQTVYKICYCFSVIEATDGEEEENITILSRATKNGKQTCLLETEESKPNSGNKLRGNYF